MMNQDQLLRVIHVKHLTEQTYVLRMERENIQFIPGQYLCLGPEKYAFMREYSIYSGVDEPFLEVLIKEVPEGDISKKLKLSKPGDKLRYKLSQSSFLNNNSGAKKKIFIATGTGISPFHSFAISKNDENFEVIHGIRHANEAYGMEVFEKNGFSLCVSGEETGYFSGRVTDYLRNKGFDIQADYYLCGNGKMIYEVFDILQQKGIKADQVNYEIYF